MKEIWKPIEFLNGRYEVSNLGRLRNAATAKILKPNHDGSGYLRLAVYGNGKYWYFRIHRLVAAAFIPNPRGLPYVDHINGERGDNRVENLRWCSGHQNANFPLALRHFKENANSRPRRIRGEKNGEVRVWNSMTECAQDLECTKTLVLFVLSEKHPGAKRAKGWTLTDVTEA